MLNKFEGRKEPLASRRVFLRRMFGYVTVSFGIVAFSLGIGILGYHIFEGLSWIDSLLNASIRLRFILLVAAHNVLVVRMVLRMSSKNVGPRSTRPRANF